MFLLSTILATLLLVLALWVYKDLIYSTANNREQHCIQGCYRALQWLLVQISILQCAPETTMVYSYVINNYGPANILLMYRTRSLSTCLLSGSTGPPSFTIATPSTAGPPPRLRTSFADYPQIRTRRSSPLCNPRPHHAPQPSSCRFSRSCWVMKWTPSISTRRSEDERRLNEEREKAAMEVV